MADPGICKESGQNQLKVEISITIYPQCLYISEFYFERGEANLILVASWSNFGPVAQPLDLLVLGNRH